jgi:hypothetical protein
LGAFFAGQSLASISAVPATLTGNQQDNLYRNTAVSGGTNLTFTSTTQFSKTISNQAVGIETLNNLSVTGTGAYITLTGAVHILAGQWGHGYDDRASLTVNGGVYTMVGTGGENNNDSQFAGSYALMGDNGINPGDVGGGNWGGRAFIGATQDVTINNAFLSLTGSYATVQSVYGNIQLTDTGVTLQNSASIGPNGTLSPSGSVTINNTSNAEINVSSSASINAGTVQITAPHVALSESGSIVGRNKTTISSIEVDGASGSGVIELDSSAHIGSHGGSAPVQLTASESIQIKGGAGVDGGEITASTPKLVLQGQNSSGTKSHIFGSNVSIQNLQNLTMGDSATAGGEIGDGSGAVSITFTLLENPSEEEGLSLSQSASISGSKVTINTGNRDVQIDSSSSINGGSAGAEINAGTGSVDLSNGGAVLSTGGTNTITGGSVSLSGGSHFGTSSDGDTTGEQTGGNMTITTPSLSLDGESYITSGGTITIKAGDGENLSIRMDQDSESGPSDIESWIKGEGGVTIGSENPGVGSTAILGGRIDSSASVKVTGGSGGIVIDQNKITATGNIDLSASSGADIEIGTNKSPDNEINKDTQIIGGNITIGSAEGTVNNSISVSDAVIGTVGGAGSGDITINAGSGKVDVTGSTVGTGSQDGSTSAAGKVEIAGGEVTIGSSSGEGAGDGDAFDTAIGGSDITIGGGNTGSVTVGDAQIGAGSQGEQSGSKVTIEVGNNGDEPGKITIGSADGSTNTNTSISGDSVTIGSATDEDGTPQGSADITIAGNRNPENSNNSTTTISGDNVTIGNGTGGVSLEGTNVVSDGDSASSGINVAVGGDGELNIKDSILDATGSLPNGEVGTGSATGNVTISGPKGETQGSIEDSKIASGGDIDFSGNLDIADSDIEAGAGTGSGSVNFGATEGDKGTVNITGGSTITGDGMTVGNDTSVNLGGRGDDADTGNRINISDGGEIKVEGSLNIAEDNAINGAGDLTVNTGENGTVNVAEGGSITAGSEDDVTTDGNLTISGNGTVNVNGGKLEANANGETGGNVVVESGDVNLSDGGSIVADGTVTVGNDQEGSSGASVNVGAGDSGTIVAGGKNEQGNNLIVTGDGVLNVGNDGLGAGDVPQNQGSLVVTTDPDASVSPNPDGGLTIGSGTHVSVSDGGYVSSSDITFEEAGDGGSAGRLEIANGGGIYTSVDTILDNAGNEESGLVFDKTEGSEFEVQISGTVSAEKDENGNSQLDQIRDIIGDSSSLVVDHIEGLDEGVIIDKDQLQKDYSSAVVGDAVIDVSGNGDNSLGFGGGGSIMVDQNEDGNGQLTIKNPADGEANTGVVITGSETDPSKEIVVGAGADADNNGQPDPVTDGKYDIALEDGADLTLGKDGSAGGTLSGSITATTSEGNEGQSSDVTVNGGNFTVEGSIDLTHQNDQAGDDGDIIIRDHNTSNPDAENGLTVVGDVNAGNLEMGGGDTNFDVNGNLDLSGDATLAGNADMDIVGGMNVGGDLDLSGTSSLGKGEQFTEGTDANLKVEGNLDITDSANVDRDSVDVNGNAHINGNGGLKTEGNFDVAGELQIGTGTDIQGGETDGGNPNVNVSGGNLTTGTPGSNGEVSSGDLTVGQGTVTVTGEAGSESEGNIIVGSTEQGGLGGDLVVGNNNDALKTPANVSAGNNITVSNGNATIYDNGHVSAGGSFVVAGTGENDGNATIEGSLTANDADIDNNLTIGKEDGGSREPNGSFVTEGSTSVGGDVIVNANGELSVGMNPSQADEGNLTVGGSFATGTDSNVDIGGDLSVEGTAQIAGSVDVDGKGTFSSGLTIADGGHYNDESGNDFVLGDGGIETEVTGNLTVGNPAPDEGEDNRIGATANLGDVTVSGTTELNKGTITAGDFNGHGDFTADAGSNFTAQGDLQLSEKDSSGAPDLIVNGGFVSAEAVGEGADATGGNIDVAGNISVSSNGSVSADGDIKAGGYVDVSSGSLTADGKLTVSGSIDGELGLTVGDEGAQPSEDGSYDKTSSVTVGSVEAENKTQIWGNGTLTVGGEAQFTGGLAMGPGADYVNNSDEKTTVGGANGGLTLDAGASVVTNGSFVLGEEIGNKVGTSASPESGTLNGTISAGSIDFGSYENASNQDTITFEGGSTGTDDAASRFEAGFETGSLTGNVALSNGANAVLTPGADGSAPTVNGFITVKAGNEADQKFGNTLTTNSANKGVYSGADVEQGNTYDAVINLDSSIQFTGESSGLIVGDVTGDHTTSGSGVYFGDNSTLVIDASNMTSGSALFADSEGNSLGIDYVGADEGSVSVDLSGWLMGTSGSLAFAVDEEDEGKFDFTSSNVLQDFVISNGEISMQVKSIEEVTGGTLDGDLQDVVHNVTANGGNNYVSRAFNALFSSGTGAYGTLTEDGKFTLTGTGNQAAREIATFPVTAGAFNATYDYLTEFNRAVESRAQQKRIGDANNAVWAQVIATYNKSDELFSDASGYKADLYGGVLGTDVRLGNGTLIGGALTVGTGDIESRGAVIGTKNDATFYGLSVYAQHDIGLMSLKGDVTYLRTENDIAGTFEGVNMGGSMDSDAVSLGVRAEFAAYSSDTFEVKPHIGLRYTNYSFDDYNGTEIDDVNALEAPIGVAFSGKVQAKGGWTVVPELDLSVVPQLGDKEASVVNAGAAVDQRVLEGAVFNAKIGLGMQKDNFTFGANFQHGAGGFSRNNNAFQAFARWTF